MFRYALALLLLLSAAPLSAADGEDTLRAYIIEKAKAANGKLELPVKSGAGKAQPATILSATAQGLRVRQQGAEIDIPWKLIGSDGLFEMSRPLIDDAPADVHAAYLRFAKATNRANGAGYEKLLGALYKKSPEIAKALDAAPPAPKAAPKDSPKDPLAQTSATPADPSEPNEQTLRAAGIKVMPANLKAFVGQAVSKNGKANSGAYAAEALAGDLGAINRMLGPGWSDFPHESKDADFPTAPAAEQKHSGKIGRNGQGFPYQWGTPTADPGGYWTTQGQALYVPDKPEDPGVDRVEVGSFGHNVLNFAPAHAWWGGAHPEPGVKQKHWAELTGGQLGQPFAIARSTQAYSENGFMLFKSGLVGAGSVNNVDTYPAMMFPRHKVPTAIAMTSKNEFAFVTIWDVKELKGQLAVLALGALDPKANRTVYGLGSWGVMNYVKLLGYVDLPIVAPSAVAATSFGRGGCAASAGEYAFEDPAFREARFKSEEVPRTGVALVISRAESKAVFVDLRPLLLGFAEMYLTTQENADKCKNAGPAPEQWPYSFDVDPRFMPKVLTTVSVPIPTAAKLSPSGSNGRPTVGVIGCMEGELHVFDIAGMERNEPHTPRDIVARGGAKVGRNPCAISYQRYGDPHRPGQGTDVAGWGSIQNVFLVCCRGDREIDWVEVTSTGVDVYRRFRDSRLVDPVDVEQSRINSGDGGYIVTVADFKGRKLVSYRAGPVSIGGKQIPIPDGKSEFEFTGTMAFPGYIFRINTDNVP